MNRIADVDPELLRFGLFILVFAVLFLAAIVLVALCFWLVAGGAALLRRLFPQGVVMTGGLSRWFTPHVPAHETGDDAQEGL